MSKARPLAAKIEGEEEELSKLKALGEVLDRGELVRRWTKAERTARLRPAPLSEAVVVGGKRDAIAWPHGVDARAAAADASTRGGDLENILVVDATSRCDDESDIADHALEAIDDGGGDYSHHTRGPSNRERRERRLRQRRRRRRRRTTTAMTTTRRRSAPAR
mmetsp:Transcript_7408/g.24439  ORF Transcript_7408/g.24439 Transcript_7408/m.24439 type:complete len:163 (-) Transcript_7408:1720-2208(-)